MTELGMTPASRSRVAADDPRMQVPEITLHHDLRGEAGGRASEKIEPSRAGWSGSDEPALPAAGRPAAAGTAERLPSCPPHLNPPAATEWRRIAKALQQAGVLTTFDRAALAAYCQA